MAIGRDPRPVLASVRSAVGPVLVAVAMAGVCLAILLIGVLCAFAGQMLLGRGGALVGSFVGGVIVAAVLSGVVMRGLGGR